jgi:RNA polymerase sigma-70 factor (ECF subfamily)
MNIYFTKRLKLNDEEAIEEFINHYKSKIYLTAYRITLNKEDALDIMQDVLAKIFNNINKIDEVKYIDAYINKIASNCAYDYIKTRFKPNSFEDILQFFSKKQKTPVESFTREELRQKVLSAINKLSKGERKIIILKYFNDLKINEISVALGISEGTVKKQIFRAKKKLERILRKDIK